MMDSCEKSAPQGPSTLESPQNRKVTLERFVLLKVLGTGTYGKVMLSREKATSRLYAIKVIKKEVIKAQNEYDHIGAENRVLRSNNHPFLISLKYSFQTNDRLYFVMEYVNGGDLFFHLYRETQFSEERTRFYIAEIICAISYLHARNIIYRDLKLENILLDKDGHIKITDFGLCKDDMTDGRTTKTFCGTPNYLAPEIILENREYGRAVDWWTVGILMYEMMSGKVPFHDDENDFLYLIILTRDVEFPRKFSKDARDLLTGLLMKDPTERLGSGADDAKPIMDHPFFASINWKNLELKKISPPFKPNVTSDDDTSNFDDELTGQSVEQTPPDDSENLGAPKNFPNFSYEDSTSMVS